MAQGFLHPRCKDGFTTYFPGVTSVPDPATKEELREAEAAEAEEARQQNAERMAERWGRRAKYSLDPGDRRQAEARAEEWREDVAEYYGIPKSWQHNAEMSDDEALKGTNPNHRFELPQYLFGTKDDYTNNCTNCVVAYSQRLKGYDVTACSLGESGTLRTHNRLFTAWNGREPTHASGSGLGDILEYMRECDNGALVAITVQMPRTIFSHNPGHAFVAEKRAGHVIFLDPQSGRRYNKPEEFFDLVLKDETQFMRVDDLEISDRGISACKGASK